MLVINIIPRSLCFRCIQEPQNIFSIHISIQHHSSHPRPHSSRKNTNDFFFALLRQVITLAITQQLLKMSVNQWRNDAMLQVSVQLLLQHTFQIIHWRCWIRIIPHMHTLKNRRRCIRRHKLTRTQNFSFLLRSIFNRPFTSYSFALVCLASNLFQRLQSIDTQYFILSAHRVIVHQVIGNLIDLKQSKFYQVISHPPLQIQSSIQTQMQCVVNTIQRHEFEPLLQEHGATFTAFYFQCTQRPQALPQQRTQYIHVMFTVTCTHTLQLLNHTLHSFLATIGGCHVIH